MAISLGTVATHVEPAAAGFSFATNFSTSCIAGAGGNNAADNWDHTFYYFGLTAAWANAQTYANSVNTNSTDAEAFELGYVNENTDVVVYDDAYTYACDRDWWTSPTNGGVVGLNICITVSGWRGNCNKSETRYSTTYAGWSSDVTDERAVACHETGHTLGLTHSDASSCMGVNSPAQQWTSGESGAINSYYDDDQLFGSPTIRGTSSYLWSGQSLTDATGHYRLVMQPSDGNLVLYYWDPSNNSIWNAVWATGPRGPGAYATMGSNGNFVVYGPWSNWATNTSGSNYLILQCDRNLVMYPNAGGVAKWASNTSTGGC